MLFPTQIVSALSTDINHFINHLISSGISPSYTFLIDYIIIKQTDNKCLTYSQTKLVNFFALYYLNLFVSQYIMKVTF